MFHFILKISKNHLKEYLKKIKFKTFINKNSKKYMYFKHKMYKSKFKLFASVIKFWVDNFFYKGKY